jgi:hypothetical protein
MLFGPATLNRPIPWLYFCFDFHGFALVYVSFWFDLVEEGIHQGTDHLQQAIVSILPRDLGHHLPTGRLDWVSLGRICLLQVLAMPPPSENWRRNSLNLDV